MTDCIHIGQAAKRDGCVLAYGHFNTIHPGHIRYLRHARELGPDLVVALEGDGAEDEPNPHPFSQTERAEALGLVGLADAIVLLHSNELEEVINVLKPSVLVLGRELEGANQLRGALDRLKSQGGKVEFHAGEVHYATTELLNNSERDLRRRRREQFSDACRRQGLCLENLLRSMQAWSNTHLIVLGDTIVDQYAACEAIGISAEAPVVVVRELAQRNFIGAAAVVAAHIKALGASCDLVSVVGNDSNADLVRNELQAMGIGDALSQDDSRPTTFKKRYVVDNQKLFRVSIVEEQNIDAEIEDQVIARLESLAPKSNGIVVSDFVYGVVTPRVLEAVHRLAKLHNLLLFGDLQCSTQVGSITRFRKFSLLCPNERELRLALQSTNGGIEHLSNQLLETSECERLVVKMAAEGFIAYDRKANNSIVNQSFPALSVNPVDVAGAGDSVLAVMATGLASGQGMMPTAAIACCMASLAVEVMGNKPISVAALRKNVEEVLAGFAKGS